MWDRSVFFRQQRTTDILTKKTVVSGNEYFGKIVKRLYDNLIESLYPDCCPHLHCDEYLNKIVNRLYNSLIDSLYPDCCPHLHCNEHLLKIVNRLYNNLIDLQYPDCRPHLHCTSYIICTWHMLYLLNMNREDLTACFLIVTANESLYHNGILIWTSYSLIGLHNRDTWKMDKCGLVMPFRTIGPWSYHLNGHCGVSFTSCVCWQNIGNRLKGSIYNDTCHDCRGAVRIERANSISRLSRSLSK